jgi:3-oxoadipate enol-lactonase
MSQPTCPDFSITHAQGQPTGVTVFLLHGAFGAKEYWRAQIQALAGAGHRVVAWDAPGYGLSPLPADFSIDRCAQALAELLRREGGACNVVLGHSMGGMIAQRVWAYAPQLIHGYVLSATSAAFGNSDGDWQKEFVRQRVAPLDAGSTLPQHAPGMLRAMMAAGAKGAAVDLLIATVSLMREETFRAAVAAIATFEGRALLPTMKVPVLCVAGALDRTAPAEVMAKMAGKLPHAQFVSLTEVGHFGWAEQPDTFNELLLNFLSDHFTTRSAS